MGGRGQIGVLLPPSVEGERLVFHRQGVPLRLTALFFSPRGWPRASLPWLHSLSEQMTPAVKRVPVLLQATWVP